MEEFKENLKYNLIGIGIGLIPWVILSVLYDE